MRFVLAILLVLAAVLGARGALGESAGERGVVTRVIDGDTIVVGGEHVRLIGIDTPERGDCFSRAATAATRRLIGERRVRLRFDADRRDRYGRLLAYVYRQSDGAFVNAGLVRGGFARTMTIAPNDRHAGRLAELQRAARDRRRGLWRAC